MLEEPMSTVPYSIWTSILSWFTPTVFFVFLNLTIGTIYFTSSLSTSNKPGVGVEGQREEGEEINPRFVRSPSVLQRLKSINLYSYRSQEPVTATAYEKVPDLGDFHFSFHQQTLEQGQRQQQPYLGRSPSVLQRLKSINLYSYFSPEQTTLHKNQEIYSHYTQEEAHVKEEDEQVQEHEGEGEEEEEEENQGAVDQDEAKEEESEGTQSQGQTLDEIYSQLKDSHVTRTTSDTKPASGELPTKLPRKMKKSASVKSAFLHFEEEDIVETRRPATVREGKAKAKATEEDDEVDAKADDFINKFKQQLKLQKIDSILRYKDMVNTGSGR